MTSPLFFACQLRVCLAGQLVAIGTLRVPAVEALRNQEMLDFCAQYNITCDVELLA